MNDEHSDESNPDDVFTDVIETIRGLEDDDIALLEPPSDVWDGIAAELGGDDTTTPPTNDPTTSGPVRSVTTTPPVASLSEAHERRRAQPAPPRFTGRSLLLAAAAVIVVVAAGVVAIRMARTDDTEIVATAELMFDPAAYDPLGENAVATVELVEDDEGLGIEFDAASLPSSQLGDEDLELWLLEVDDSGAVVDLVSLGVVNEIDRRFAVPEGLDPDRYGVVDISVEPRDGDAGHSGRTILRGPLTT